MAVGYAFFFVLLQMWIEMYRLMYNYRRCQGRPIGSGEAHALDSVETAGRTIDMGGMPLCGIPLINHGFDLFFINFYIV